MIDLTGTGMTWEEFNKSVMAGARQGYSFYLDGARQSSVRRLQQGRPLLHVMTFEEWCNRDDTSDRDE